MIHKYIRVLASLLMVLYPLGLITRIKISENILFVPQDLIVALLFISTTYYFVTRKINVFKNKFIKWQILFIIFGILSLFVNVLLHNDINILVSILYAARYLMYLNLIFVGSFFAKKEGLNNLVYFSGITIVLIGFIQFFLYNNLAVLVNFGWDNHLYRLFSTFLDPNFAGVFYALFFFYLLHRVSDVSLRKTYMELILSFSTLIALYLTYSRTALVVLFAGVLIFGLIKKKLKTILLVILTLVMIIFLLSETSVEGLNPLRTVSSAERIKSFNEGVYMYEKSPIYGVGFNAFRYAQLRFGIRNHLGTIVSNADAGTDNSWLFVAVTAGGVGVFIFGLSYYFLLKRLLIKNSNGSTFLVCMIFSLIAGSLFLNVLFYTPILTFVYILVGLNKEFGIKVGK